MVLGRLAQGASSAIVHTVGMAILADTVSDAGIGLALGIVTMNVAAGVLIGPVLGGILYDHQGYLAVFISAYALIAADFIARILMIEQRRTPDVGKVTIIQSSDQTYGTMRPSSARNPGSEESQVDDPSVTTSEDPLLSKHNSTITVIDLDQRSHPISTLLSSPRMLVALFCLLVHTTILTGLEATVPLRIKTIFGYSSTFVALVFLCITVPALTAPVMGYLSDRFGVRTIGSLGFLLLSLFLVLLRLIHHYDNAQVILLCALLLFLGISLHMVMTPINSEAKHIVDDMAAVRPGIFGSKGAYAQAFGLMNAAFAGGLLLGPLTGGLLIQRVGWDHLTLGAAVLSIACSAPCFLALGGRPRPKGTLSIMDDRG